MIELPAVCTSPAAPRQEGAGLSDTVDLDPPMSPLSLAPTPASSVPSLMSVPETVPETGHVSPTMTKSKIRRLRKRGIRVSTFTVERAKTTATILV
ncbi:hypothetical protein BGZ94_004167, partial [Podila epigama]